MHAIDPTSHIRGETRQHEAARRRDGSRVDVKSLGAGGQRDWIRCASERGASWLYKIFGPIKKNGEIHAFGTFAGKVKWV